MKPTTYSMSPEHSPAKKKSYPNGSAGKKYLVSKNTKSSFDGRKVSKKVHSNINFSKLDEVCLDVGKVDLSFSARLRNDSGLSPPKGSREWNGEVHETIRSCYVQLESLGPPRKSSYGMDPRVSSTEFQGTDSEDEEWKGWTSSISFSQRFGCPFVRVREGLKISEVLVMDEDLVERECKILGKPNGYKLDHSNLESSILGTCDSEKKSCEEKNFELKNKLCELFNDSRELQNFIECIDLAIVSPQFQTSPQNKSYIRKLNFGGGKIDVPSSSNGNTGAAREKPVCPVVDYNCLNEDVLLGYSDSAIFLSETYAKGFLDFYDKYNFQNGITIGTKRY